MDVRQSSIPFKCFHVGTAEAKKRCDAHPPCCRSSIRDLSKPNSLPLSFVVTIPHINKQCKKREARWAYLGALRVLPGCKPSMPCRVCNAAAVASDEREKACPSLRVRNDSLAEMLMPCIAIELPLLLHNF